MLKKLNNTHASLNKTFKKKAKEELKSNEKPKCLMKDIKVHFKQQNAWPISYEAYLDMSGLNSLIFNQVLLLHNMKIYFCKIREAVVFKKETR